MIEPTLRRILTDDPAVAPIDGVASWWARHRERTEGLAESYARAVVGGFAADRLGWAFASGYHEALVSLRPETRGHKVALCATEGAPGAHPRSIATTLVEEEGGLRLTGSKGYVTLGTEADRLLVVASVGRDEAGRNRLAVVDVPADRDGVTVEALPATPFVPEIPHARLELSGVAVAPEERLPGDGYLDVLKPFRTVEDLHVHGALLGYLVQVARRAGFAAEHLDALLSLVCAVAPLAAAPPLDPAVHVAVGAVLARAAAALEALDGEWSKAEPEVRERWARDRKLTTIAGTARQRRLDAARARLAEA